MASHKLLLLGVLLGTILAGFFVALEARDAFVVAYAPKHLARGTAMIGPLRPSSRLLSPGATGQPFIGEPMYLDVFVPRGFRRVLVSVEFENPNAQRFSFGYEAHGGLDLVPILGERGTASRTISVSDAVLHDSRLAVIFSLPDLLSGAKPIPFSVSRVTVQYLDPEWAGLPFFSRIFTYLRTSL